MLYSTLNNVAIFFIWTGGIAFAALGLIYLFAAVCSAWQGITINETLMRRTTIVLVGMVIGGIISGILLTFCAALLRAVLPMH